MSTKVTDFMKARQIVIEYESRNSHVEKPNVKGLLKRLGHQMIVVNGEPRHLGDCSIEQLEDFAEGLYEDARAYVDSKGGLIEEAHPEIFNRLQQWMDYETGKLPIPIRPKVYVSYKDK